MGDFIAGAAYLIVMIMASVAILLFFIGIPAFLIVLALS